MDQNPPSLTQRYDLLSLLANGLSFDQKMNGEYQNTMICLNLTGSFVTPNHKTPFTSQSVHVRWRNPFISQQVCCRGKENIMQILGYILRSVVLQPEVKCHVFIHLKPEEEKLMGKKFSIFIPKHEDLIQQISEAPVDSKFGMQV